MKKTILKSKKVMVVLVALVLLGLAACGRENNDENGDDTANNQDTVVTDNNVNDTAGTAAVQDTPMAPVLDLDGRTITSATWWNIWGERHTGSEPPDPATSSNYLVDRMQWENMRRVEEEFNVSFDYIIVAQGEIVAALLASVLAGDSLGDVIYLLGPHTFSAIIGDMLHNAGTFASPDSDLLNARTYVTPRAIMDGEIWTFSDNFPMVHGMGMGVNLDIINAVGAPNPVDLFNAGEWTWDAMREIMLMATMDTTGDGVVDQFGISGQPHNIMINLIAANNGHLVDPETFTYGFGDPNTLEAFEFIYEIFNTLNVWHYDVGAANPMGDWTRNMWSFREGRSALFTAATWLVGSSDDMPFNYAFVPYPKGPSNPYSYVRMYGLPSGYAIPITTQNPQDVFRILEEVQSWPGDEPELVTFTAINYANPSWLTEDDIWRVLYVGENVKHDLGMSIHGYYWVLGDFAYNFWHGHMTVAQAVETFRPQQQEMIDIALGN